MTLESLGTDIFVLAAGGTLQIGVVFGRSDRIVALCEGDFALPEGVERTVFGADIDGRGFGQVTLRGTHVAGAVRLQAAEIGDLLQCGSDVGILCREGFDGPVSRVVIVRIVVGRDQQRTGFAHARRIGILRDYHFAQQIAQQWGGQCRNPLFVTKSFA